MEMLNLAKTTILEKGWGDFDLLDVAVAAGKPLYEIQEMFQDKYGVLTALVTQHTHDLEPIPFEGNIHEYLFECLMARFDELADDRPLVQVLRNGLFQDLKMGCRVASPLEAWIGDVLSVAGLDKSWAVVRTKGLLLVYLAALDVWLGDETPDLSPTMATLDQRLTDFACIFGNA